MSAHLLVLPRLHATAAASSHRRPHLVTEGALARTAHALHQHADDVAAGTAASPGHALKAPPAIAQPFDPAKRKGPHRLHLVQAAAVDAAAGPARLATVLQLPVGPRQQPSHLVAGVAMEFYRTYTEAMLRRYSKLSMESGRVPSLLGRELFKGNVTSCKVHSFEDVSNFVLDMERAIAQLTPGERHLIRRIAVEEYTQAETAGLCGLSLRSVVRHYAVAVDKLSRILVDRKLLQPLAPCSC